VWLQRTRNPGPPEGRIDFRKHGDTFAGAAGRAPSALSGVYAAALEEYVELLRRRRWRRRPAARMRPRSASTLPGWRALTWTASRCRARRGAIGGARLPHPSPSGAQAHARDGQQRPRAVDDLYIRRGLGPADAKRLEIPAAAPRALDQRAQIRYLRAVQASASQRDRALALVPFYAGARISETVALDLDDLRLSARRAILRIYGKGERVRESRSTRSCARRSRTGLRTASAGVAARTVRCL